MAKFKLDRNPARAYQQGFNAGRENGIVAVTYFAIRALYNVVDDFVPEDKQNGLYAAFDSELARIVNDELSVMANGEDSSDNIDYAVAIVNNLREKIGLERY